MPVVIGDINKLKVKRETDISYLLHPLDDVEREIFMHFNETKTPLKVGDIVDAFLFFDNKQRLCATTYPPTATINKVGWGTCVNIDPRIGCFMNIGISKDILLSKDFLPKSSFGWPKENDKLPIIIHPKKDRLTSSIATKNELATKSNLQIKDSTEAVVSGFLPTGIYVVTDNLEYIYIHRSLLRKKYHLGERIEVTISNINKDGELDGSLIKAKEDMIGPDSEMILKYLNEFGTLPIGDKSSPEDINKYLPLSKSAFKRAIGSLYKRQLVTIEDYRITLIKK